jgi:hypothetical protein
MEDTNAKRIVDEMKEQMFAPELEAGREAKQVTEELANLNPNVEMDAKEFGEHVRNGGWRLGLLVARSVEVGKNKGGDRKSENINWENSQLIEKVSALAFARQAGNITNKTVQKYLTAWDLAAADGLVPTSSDLSPGQSFTFNEEEHTPETWKQYFKTPGEPNDKNAFIALNDTVTSFSSKVEEKWDDAKLAYEEQREVSLETLRENVKGTIDVLTSLLNEINREAKSKKYIDLNQE